MTDEMAIQGQRPSAMPYVLGGAVVGGGAGAFAASKGLMAKPRFSDWKAAVEEANQNDSFVKKQAEALKDDAEKVKPYKTIKDEAGKIKTAEDALNALKLPDGFDGQEELKTYYTKEEAVETAQKALDTKKESVLEKERNAIKDWTPPTADSEKKTYTFDGKEYTKDELNGIIEKAGKDQTVTENKTAKELLDKMAESRVEGGFDKAVEAEKNALTTAQTEFDKAKEALGKKTKGEEVLKGDFLKNRKAAETTLNETKATAEKNIKAVLDKVAKKPQYLWPTVIGAVALGLGGLLLRPSGEDA